ncbi:MAG TPA: molybdopterin-guanine dinucleotide biosynthesis protein MobB [Gemmatimonadales bacterium]|nr:molybdopterin-guanine dinucleotide biosynthesis protein MobB [Gemmatimonadales bacterium]
MAETRILSIVGRPGAGKTTLAVALASEYVRKGKRVMAIKHAGIVPGLDRIDSDGQRLFHEGKAERVIVATPGARVITERRFDDTDPIALARQYFDGADIVLVEGFTASQVPKIEVFRRAVADVPLYQSSLPSAGLWLAIVTDADELAADCAVLRFRDTMWLQLLANLGWEKALRI